MTTQSQRKRGADEDQPSASQRPAERRERDSRLMAPFLIRQDDPCPIVVPVRHHSPVCARLVEEVIREHQPQLVLIEGPSDAAHLISALTDPETEPPVAIVAYRRMKSRSGDTSDGSEQRSSLIYPFCEYSPEWVAMREGRKIGAEVLFCDLPAGEMLDCQGPADDEEMVEAAAPDGPIPVGDDLDTALIARAFGFRHIEEWWEALFEAQQHDRAALMALLMAFGAESGGPADPIDGRREAFMWNMAQQAIASGTAPGKVLLVCGAAHAARFPPEAPRQSGAKSSAPAELSLTPYTFAHLSRRSGYGAGNPCPLFWQRAWDRGGLEPASAASLVAIADALRRRGWQPSTSDAITALGTAMQLAGLRNKPAPGADEVVLAASSVWSPERTRPFCEALDEALIGGRAGTVPEGAGASPLTSDFTRRARRFWRTLDATERDERLRLTVPIESEKSRFLHRLRIIGIPFARLRDSCIAPGSALWRQYEVWLRSFTPQVSIALAEASPEGASVMEVATRRLEERIGAHPGVMASVEITLDAALSGILEMLPAGLQAVDAASVMSSAWEELSRGAARLARLPLDPSILESVRESAAALAGRLLVRSCETLRTAADSTSERARSVAEAMLELEGAVISTPYLNATNWRAVLRSLTGADNVHPFLAGVATAILHAAAALEVGRLETILSSHLLAARSPEEGAEFISGLLSPNRAVLLRSRPLAAAIGDFVRMLPDDRFVEVLPVLRRAFSGLSRSEVRLLLEALRQRSFPAASPDPDPTRVPPGNRSDLLAAIQRALQGIERALEQGVSGTVPEALEGLTALLSRSEISSAREAMPLVEMAAVPGARSFALIAAWTVLDQARFEISPLIEAPAGIQAPGLSFACVPAARSQLPEARGEAWQEEIRSILTDGRRETRPGRVLTVARALAEASSAAELAMLLAHGDYHHMAIRRFSELSDGLPLAWSCRNSNNPLVRRAALLLANRLLPTHDDIEFGPIALLARALGAEDWKLAYRLLGHSPAALLDWVERLGPRPEEVTANSREERLMARGARRVSGHPAAARWLRECLKGPDRLSLEASCSLTLLGALSPEELRWSCEARDGDEGNRVWLQYELFSRRRSVQSLFEEGIDEELFGSAGDHWIEELASYTQSGETAWSRGALLAEALGSSGANEAIPTLTRYLDSGGPLVANAAASALGRIGAPEAAPPLLNKKRVRKSDLDRVILESLARIGDLRSWSTLESRLTSARPEEILPEETALLRSFGEAGSALAVRWFNAGSVTLRAAAALAVRDLDPATLREAQASRPAAERSEDLVAELLLPGSDSPTVAGELLELLRSPGNSTLPSVIRGLQVATGDAEVALVDLLRRLRSIAAILPTLRVARAATWKAVIGAAPGEAARPTLEAALQSDDPGVRRGASDALSLLETSARSTKKSE